MILERQRRAEKKCGALKMDWTYRSPKGTKVYLFLEVLVVKLVLLVFMYNTNIMSLDFEIIYIDPQFY